MKTRKYMVCTGPVVVPSDEGVEIITAPLQHTVYGTGIQYKLVTSDVIFFHVMNGDVPMFGTAAHLVLWFTCSDVSPILASAAPPIDTLDEPA